jgi:hypothetical protein
MRVHWNFGSLGKFVERAMHSALLVGLDLLYPGRIWHVPPLEIGQIPLDEFLFRCSLRSNGSARKTNSEQREEATARERNETFMIVPFGFSAGTFFALPEPIARNSVRRFVVGAWCCWRLRTSSESVGEQLVAVDEVHQTGGGARSVHRQVHLAKERRIARVAWRLADFGKSYSRFIRRSSCWKRGSWRMGSHSGLTFRSRLPDRVGRLRASAGRGSARPEGVEPPK